MSRTKVSPLLRALRKREACQEGLEWAAAYATPAAAWAACERPDWLLWALGRIGYQGPSELRLYACWCARSTPLADGRTTWDLLTDPRSRAVVEVAERFARGEATGQELAAAAAASWAAAAARGAAASSLAAAAVFAVDAASWAAAAAVSAAEAASWAADAVAWTAAVSAAWTAVSAAWAAEAASDAAWRAAAKAQAVALRDIVGDPFADWTEERLRRTRR